MAVSTEQIAKVLMELHQSQGEATAAQLLLKALPHLFGGEQHQFQLNLTDMLRDTLKQARVAGAEKQASTVVALDEIKASLETKRQKLLEAENHETGTQEVVKEKASELSEKKQATKTEEARDAEAKRTKGEVEQEKLKLEEAKAEVDAVANGSMQMLLQGGWEGEEARDDFVKPVCEYLQNMGCDKVLLASLPKALGCCPDSRGPFSKLTVDAAVQQLTERSTNIQQQLDADAEKFEQVSAESLGAWAIADVARDSEREATEAKESAEAKNQEAVVAVKLAKNMVMEAETELNRILSEQTLLETKVQDIDMALAEIVRLESEALQADKENEDDAMPPAKRMKTGEAETDTMTLEVPPAISVQ